MSFATHATTKKLETHLKQIGAYQAVRNPNYSFDAREAVQRKASLAPPRKTASGNRKKNTTVANRKKQWMVTSESALSKPPALKVAPDASNEASRTKIMGQYAKDFIPKGTELSFYEVVQARDISGLRHIPLKEPHSNLCIDITRLRQGLEGYKKLSERACNVEVRCTLTNFTPPPSLSSTTEPTVALPVDQMTTLVDKLAPLLLTAVDTNSTQSEPTPVVDDVKLEQVPFVASETQEASINWVKGGIAPPPPSHSDANPIVDDEEFDRMLERKAKSAHLDDKDDKYKSKSKSKSKKKKKNVKVDKPDKKEADVPGCEITYFASRDIQAGEEIYTSFGPGYWMLNVLDQYPALLADRLVSVVSELVLQELKKPNVPFHHAYNVAAILYAISNGVQDLEDELKGIK